MTGKVAGLNNIAPASFIEMNPATAEKLGVIDGGKVRVLSRRGEIATTVKLTKKIKGSVVFMPFHFADGAVNVLTNPALDPIAKEPEYKVCAVNIVPVDLMEQASEFSA
jgi:formate dehydrogenase major subunit